MSEKFTDEQIIEALELCAQDKTGACEKCAYREGCKAGDYTRIFKDALDLINRQGSEIRTAAFKEFGERVKQRVKGIYLDEQELAEVLDEIEKEVTT